MKNSSINPLTIKIYTLKSIWDWFSQPVHKNWSLTYMQCEISLHLVPYYWVEQLKCFYNYLFWANWKKKKCVCARCGDAQKHSLSELIKLSDACKNTADVNPWKATNRERLWSPNPDGRPPRTVSRELSTEKDQGRVIFDKLNNLRCMKSRLRESMNTAAFSFSHTVS